MPRQCGHIGVIGFCAAGGHWYSICKASGCRGFRLHNIQHAPHIPGQSVVAKGKFNGGNSFSVRYHPNNNPQYYIYSLGGSSVADVAGKFCK